MRVRQQTTASLRAPQAATPTSSRRCRRAEGIPGGNASDGENGADAGESAGACAEVDADGGTSEYELCETLRQKWMRELATARLECGKMKKSTLRKDKAPAVLEVGTIVQLAVSDVDRSRVDAVNVTLVVVEQVEKGEKSNEVKYRLACKAGILKTLYRHSNVRALVEQKPFAYGLESTLQ
eukprot:5771639-Pleurochrysis_carterae.AAC.1